MLADLSEIGVAFLMVEGGGKLASALLECELVDEIILYEGGQSLVNLLADIEPVPQSSWINSPVVPNIVPKGFHLSDQWKYGNDKVTRYILNS